MMDLCLSPYLYGMHEECPAAVLPIGWVLKLAELGDGNNPHPGLDFSNTNKLGLGSIGRLQYSWGGAGTIPPLEKMGGYLRRVYSCVNNSKFCHVWVPFNEPNHPNEWIAGKVITPDRAADVYMDVWKTIHNVPGHEFDQVMLPPLAPWIALSGLPHWIEYYTQMIQIILDAGGTIDAIGLHTYSRGGSARAVVDSQDKMGWPYDMYFNGFNTYQDFLHATPKELSHLPVYITETNQGDQEWDENDTGWVRSAYHNIDAWNHVAGNQTIRALLLYRWPRAGKDKWHIYDKPGVHSDLIKAMDHEYTWDDVVVDVPATCYMELRMSVYVPELKRTITLVGRLEEERE